MNTVFKIIVLAWLMIPGFSVACKQAALNQNYPVTNFDLYKSIVIVKIDSSKHTENYLYRPLVSFKATVLGSMKGSLKTGDSFSGKATTEVAHAVCPAHLVDGDVYLLLLTHENNLYSLSRFSFPVRSDNEYFSEYITQISSSLRNE